MPDTNLGDDTLSRLRLAHKAEMDALRAKQAAEKAVVEVEEEEGIGVKETEVKETGVFELLSKKLFGSKK